MAVTIQDKGRLFGTIAKEFQELAELERSTVADLSREGVDFSV
ncbi:MAG: hypothetical protein WCO05_04260 [Candidatus Moraniibacteriota bacterium]